MNQIIVTFGKAGLPDYDLTWNVLDHRPAEIWFKLFQHELMKNREYFFRFSGFMNNEKTEEDLLRKL